MSDDRIAIDTVAAVDLFHPERVTPPAIETAKDLLIPLPVVGELRYGAENASEPSRPAMRPHSRT